MTKPMNDADMFSVEQARELAEKALNECNEENYLLSTIADKCGVYRHLFEYLLDKYKDDEVVHKTLNRLYNKCESIITEKMANNVISQGLGIFLLKNVHGLIDKEDAEGQGDIPRITKIEIVHVNKQEGSV
jgi:hypothetical protein